MNKANTILQITSEVLDRYRNSITRKAFTQAMERVIELVLGPGEQPRRQRALACRYSETRRWILSTWRNCSAVRVHRFHRSKRTLTARSSTARPAGSLG